MGTVDDFEGLFKHVYAGRVENQIPSTDICAKDMKFVPGEQREGNNFLQPVTLTNEHGITFNTDGSAFSLNSAVALTNKEASVNGAELVVRSTVSYGAMQKALKAAKSGGARAFVQATRFQVQNLLESASKVRELSLLYGPGTSTTPSAYSGLGKVESVGGDHPTWTLVITDETWSTALWSGMENCPIEIWDGTTLDNTSTATVSAVDPSTRTITVTTTVDPATEGGDPAANDHIFFKGQRVAATGAGKDMVGLVEVAQNTGTLWGISATTYNLWAGSTYAVGGQLTFGKVLEGLVRPGDLGFRGTMVVLVNPAAWQDINEDQASLRRYAGKAGGKLDQGAEHITFYGQTGSVELKPHIFMKRGLAAAYCKDHCQRVGATDLTFQMPGFGRILHELPDNAGVEYRVYANQAFFTPRPQLVTLYTGITPTASPA